ncbi:MAG: acyl-CoA reductase [Maribacter sp.]
MTQHHLRLEAFVKLGAFFNSFCEFMDSSVVSKNSSDTWLNAFKNEVEMARHHNGWFTVAQCIHAFGEWGTLLTEKNLRQWMGAYDFKNGEQKTIALIMAGNIPLVGFHDLLSVLITGNKALVKLSSNDQKLIPLIFDYLKHIEPHFKDSAIFTNDKLGAYDAVIATGSNNTARYFEYYFGKKPNIIRKNRNSVAVLTGQESSADLTALGEDVFRYFGLGCRSVSKLFVPSGYNFDAFYTAIYGFKDIVNHHKYANNYDYNKAVYLMSEFKILDNGFLVLKEDKSYASPIASVFFEYYDDPSELKSRLTSETDKIQCIVSKGFLEHEIAFGETQKPSLHDYADGVDTVQFLLKTSGN